MITLKYYSNLDCSEKKIIDRYVEGMDKVTYGEIGPNFLNFIKNVGELREKAGNNLYNTIIISFDRIDTSKDIIGLGSIIDDDQGTKKKYNLEEGVFVGGVNINPLYRGQGYGTRLFKEIINHIKYNYSGNVYLFTDNPIAEKIYKKFGFEVIDVILNKYGDKEKLMVKEF